ncbi:hypothetical protein M408DRAFT_74576, partial [Serendipita vermifera MAFF 305830]
MRTPTDPNSFLSQEEIINARNVVHELEMAIKENLDIIEQAKIRIVALEKEIQAQRTLTASIRRLPFEILTEIFVCCSLVSPLIPEKITEVCRLWRQVVLATPQAW